MVCHNYLLKSMNIFKIFIKKHYFGGAFLIMSAMFANILNFVFNAYLGRTLTLADFGLLSLVGSFYAFSTIAFNSLSSVINYRAGFLIGRYGISAGNEFLKYMQKLSMIVAVIASFLWVVAIPLLASYFHTTNYFIFLLFTPVWLIGFHAFVNKGYVSSKLQFGLLGLLIIIEPLSKLLTTILLVSLHAREYSYIAIPVSIIGIFVTTKFILTKSRTKVLVKRKSIVKFPIKYFLSSFLVGLSTLSFVSLDVVLARHYLTPEQAGQYALVSLIGKMVYFMSGLTSQFVTPLVSRLEGEKKDSKKLFYKILFWSFLLSLGAFVPLGLLAPTFAPLLFGAKVLPVLQFLPSFLFAMMAFSLSRIFVNYYQVKKLYIFPLLAFLLSILQVLFIGFMHRGVGDIVNGMVLTGIINLLIVGVFHLNLKIAYILEFNLGDFLALFKKHRLSQPMEGKLNILIFNWRDKKHKWGGGAEEYIHEIARRWVDDGNSVTLFCGNDYESKKNEVIDGIEIMRRGGFYTMYVWAAIYYIFKLRGKYDVVIDSENGIPFFTPLFSRKPIYLLIHHVHQEVFLVHLKFPFAQFARFIEGKCMPFVYQNKQIITVSESSKREIMKLGFANSSEVKIVNPGVELEKFGKIKKSKLPTLVYVGRLKPYKNVDIAIKAFNKVVLIHPEAIFHIVGEGESFDNLKKLSRQLNLAKNVVFHGKVGHKKKARLLATSWAAVQPSMIEGWGITVIEANASGTPVIASNVNGLRDSIVDRKTGLLVKAKDTNEFANAMLRTIESSTFRGKITKNAYAWSKNFDWDKSSNLFYYFMSMNRNLAGVNRLGRSAFAHKA